MPLYTYEAAARDGKTMRGAIEASTRAAAVERLLQQGLTPLSLAEDEGQGAARRPASILPVWRSRVGARTRARMLQELSVFLRAGLTVERSLATLSAVTAAPETRKVIEAILEGLRTGEALSAAMSRGGDMFPETMRRLVAAGEASGRLPEVITRIADAEASARDLSDKLLSAMIYPALLLTTMLGVLALIFTNVLPQLEPILAGSGPATPWPAAMLMATSRFLNDYGASLGLTMFAALLAGLYLLRQPTVQFRLDQHAIRARYLLRIPLHYQTAQFFRNLGMLVEGGVQLNRALELSQQVVSNRFLRHGLDEVIAGVKQGRSLHSALGDAGMFPHIAVEFVAVGEGTGRLAQMLVEAADMFDRDVQTRVERLSALLLPGVTIILGLVVAAIMTGVVSGIFAANDMALVP